MTHKHYIYVYLDPIKSGSYEYSECCFGNEPFYIGLGSGNRDTAHMRKSNLVNDPNKHKTNKIKKLLENNQQPIIKRIFTNLTFEEACKIEKTLIKSIGRNDLGKGPLTNMSNGGEGYTGPKSDEHKRKLSIAHLGKTVIWSQESLRKRAESRKRNHKGYDLESRLKISTTRIERGVAAGNKNPAFRHDIDDNKILELRNNGMSLRQIAKIFNTTHRTISGRLKRCHI